MNGLGQLVPLVNDALWHGFVIFLRVSAITAMLPGFGEQTVPARIKLVIAMAFTLIVAPIITTVPLPPTFGDVAFLTMTEILSGLAIGIGIRLFVLALQTAGTIAAHATSLSQVLGGAGVDPMPAMGYVLIIGGIALAVMLGLHVKAAELIILSYDVLPMGRFTSASVLSDWGVTQVARAFTLAFTLAAPFIVLSVLYNVALGAINKAMPQLMVAFVGAPLITAGGLFLLLMSAPLILSVWSHALDSFLANPFGTPQ